MGVQAARQPGAGQAEQSAGQDRPGPGLGDRREAEDRRQTEVEGVEDAVVLGDAAGEPEPGRDRRDVAGQRIDAEDPVARGAEERAVPGELEVELAGEPARELDRRAIEEYGVPEGVRIVETMNGGSRGREDAIAQQMASSSGSRLSSVR